MAVQFAEPPHLATDLKTLCLSTITAQWRPLAEQATRQRQAPADYLAQLVHLEVTGRRERRIQRPHSDARFPMLKTLDAFSFEAQPDLDRDAVLQVFDVLEPSVGDVGGDLLHGVEAEVAAVGEDRGQQGADLPGVDSLLARLLEVDAEPEVVLDLDEQVGQPDRAAAGVQPDGPDRRPTVQPSCLYPNRGDGNRIRGEPHQNPTADPPMSIPERPLTIL